MMGNIPSEPVRLQKLAGTFKDRNGNKSIFCIGKYFYLLFAPFNISDRCCLVMKKRPAHSFQTTNKKQPMIATMAEESRLRQSNWLRSGCNAFTSRYPRSAPMSFWNENDVLRYIHENNLQISEAYGEVIVKGTEYGQIALEDVLGDYRDCQFCTTKANRTGCVFCCFGITHDTNRFILLSKEEPKLCDYVMRGGAFDTDGMWKPTNEGMGYWFVLKWLNLKGGYKINIPNEEYYAEKYGNSETEKYLAERID
jgi:3'-phosphoadenosine 5'-phosphosulfate sulfotransferase (PAPS reductase)/FAD synthetase